MKVKYFLVIFFQRLETIEAVVTEAVVTAQQKLGDCITFEVSRMLEIDVL